MSGTDNGKHPVWITGIGLLSSLGEGADAHWDALNTGKPQNLETETFAPYPVHALGEVDWQSQISRRDIRQMEPWQQIGTYAAGLALSDANAKEDEELCGRMDMIVAAGGGERDIEVDGTVLAENRGAEPSDAKMAERLSNDLRPTLFLAQLSNLLAGNISIVHKVTGSSRTFMGEEGAGISAVQTASARIASGQSDVVLVGGAFNAERADMQLVFELGQYLMQGDWAPVWDRAESSPGMALGSIGAFMVLESEEHAKKRGAKPYAQIADVVSDSGKRGSTAAETRLGNLVERIGVGTDVPVFSGASGAGEATAIERNVVGDNAAIRAYGSLTGHGVEAHFPLGVALAATALQRGALPPPVGALETAHDGAVEQILVTGVGHWRSEGLALLKRTGTAE